MLHVAGVYLGQACFLKQARGVLGILFHAAPLGGEDVLAGLGPTLMEGSPVVQAPPPWESRTASASSLGLPTPACGASQPSIRLPGKHCRLPVRPTKFSWQLCNYPSSASVLG